jgi:DNA-binding NtrC family response regulator
MLSSKQTAAEVLLRVKTMQMEQTPKLEDKKTILVVDDDSGILKMISESLGNEYNILSASSGAEALRQSNDFKSEIYLLLSDFQMPGMTGMELASQITVQRPKIKVLLMSGYPAGTLVLNEGWHFLTKPFVQSQMRALVTGLVYPDKATRFSA